MGACEIVWLQNRARVIQPKQGEAGVASFEPHDMRLVPSKLDRLNQLAITELVEATQNCQQRAFPIFSIFR